MEVGPERWLVRRFRHGGILRALGENWFLDAARPLAELENACALAAAGLPTARVIAARAVRMRPFGWRLALVTARVEGVRDGAEWLERVRSGLVEARVRAALFREAGELVGRMHSAGFVHGDLHPRNFVFDAAANAWILDLDRGVFASRLRDATRRDNLRRLYRAVSRRERRGARFLTRADYRRFFAGYSRGYPEASEWRADWRAILRRHRSFAPVHRLGWWLEAWLGSGPEQRDGAAARPR
jgi:tRNA A-37 threonylcarbamoyl transferase component Bud32